jgi:hypothetical protein
MPKIVKKLQNRKGKILGKTLEKISGHKILKQNLVENFKKYKS